MSSLSSSPSSSSSLCVPPQDLGADFHFESDSGALRSILNNRGLTPRLKPITSTALTPASNLPSRYRRFEDRFDFFEGKNGTVFYRPSARFLRPRDPGGGGGSGAKSSCKVRAFQRGLDLGPPRRVGAAAAMTMAMGRKTPIHGGDKGKAARRGAPGARGGRDPLG